VPRALRRTVGRLILFYLGAITVLVGIVPWTSVQPTANITASPFVSVFESVGIPAAAHVVNLVVITAAASSMNCNLYMASRMLFSLARGGYAPPSLGRVSSLGIPLLALIASAAGLAIALAVAFVFPESAFRYLLGISLFGGLFVWLMIFITHLAFRPAWIARGGARLPVQLVGYPYTSILGAASIAAILATTWWVEGMRITLVSGLPWLALVTLAYFIVNRRRSRDDGRTRTVIVPTTSA
jgi:L-asparagine transporter-like permease